MDLRYPIGQFAFDVELTPGLIDTWIKEIDVAPVLLREAVADLQDEQLDTPYRPGGWTVRQVVHHLADSHMNSYIRFKLALTEDKPTIKPYMEEKWAELTDSKLTIEVSLTLLESLHKRWTALLRDLSPSELGRTFIHPESGEVKLGTAIGLYSWHCRHHLAHITSLRKRLDW